MDTGWLLVGVAGVTGGLALVLVGAGLATTPLLLPVGLLLAAVAYLAWAAGRSRVVATVYEEVGDSGRADATGRAGQTGRTGRAEARSDPDGNWRRGAGGGEHDRRRTDSSVGGPSAGESSRGGAAGLGPDGERIWDARERDRVGGWDDWDADWEWADRHWRSFQREYGDAEWTEDASGPGATGRTDSGTERGTGPRRDDGTGAAGRGGQRRGSGASAGARQRTRSRSRGAQSRDERRRRRRHRTGSGRRVAERPRDRRTRRARDLLGVSADADPQAIRAAYRSRVKEVHPDRGGDPEQFKRVQWAYEYLSEE